MMADGPSPNNAGKKTGKVGKKARMFAMERKKIIIGELPREAELLGQLAELAAGRGYQARQYEDEVKDLYAIPANELWESAKGVMNKPGSILIHQAQESFFGDDLPRFLPGDAALPDGLGGEVDTYMQLVFTRASSAAEWFAMLTGTPLGSLYAELLYTRDGLIYFESLADIPWYLPAINN